MKTATAKVESKVFLKAVQRYSAGSELCGEEKVVGSWDHLIREAFNLSF